MDITSIYRELKTDRLTIRSLTKEGLLQYMLMDNYPETTRIKDTIKGQIIPAIDTNPQAILFHTFWIAIDNLLQQAVADIRFKGPPDMNGEIEIGYGTYAAFQGKGLMTEAVSAMIEWAFQQEKIKTVTAETDPGNVASQRILIKTGFIKTGESLETIFWRKNKKL